ncbi:MAG: hypothetical protein J6C33_07395 [Lachnospiraceae bacterium]|nr:hypothetical protein [Lachnospiraceae bacterium]
MISCKINELKNFMGRLLATDCFDDFLLEEAVIATYNTFTIDGRLKKEFYTSEEWNDPSVRPYSFSCWQDVRPICFSLIKGKKTPASLKFVLQLKPEKMNSLLAENGLSPSDETVKVLVVTIRYGAGGMSCTTGISLSGFSLDKTAEKLWDKAFLQFLDANKISYGL